MRERWTVFTLLVMSPWLLTGCAGYGAMMALSQASMALHTASQAVHLGTSIASLMEQTEVKAALAPGVTPEELRQIKRLALFFQAEGLPGGNLSAVVADNVAVELLALGYQVMDQGQVRRAAEAGGIRAAGVESPEAIARLGRANGVDAVVLGSITAASEIAGGFTVSRVGMGQVIQNATLRVVGVERGEVVLAVALSYKKGQTPAEAAKVIAHVLREKLQGAPAGKN
jgi:hypothetical protein